MGHEYLNQYVNSPLYFLGVIFKFHCLRKVKPKYMRPKNNKLISEREGGFHFLYYVFLQFLKNNEVNSLCNMKKIV